MSTFFLDLALAYAAATLLPSAFAHLAGPRRFAGLVRGHGVLPAGLVPVVALLLPVAEAAVGLGALQALVVRRTATTTLVLAGSTGLGLLFLAYLRQLVHGPSSGRAAATSCGCSPFSERRTRGRVTSASFAPAGGLVLFGGLALWGQTVLDQTVLGLASAPGDAVTGAAVVRALPVVWGSTLAVLAALIPATVPLGSAIDPSQEVTS